MLRIRECTDLEECQHIWKRVWPAECIFDVWEVRVCFQKAFNRPVHFIVAEDEKNILGVLALSWISEEQNFAAFPGETWRGKTWLEQNKFPASHSVIRSELLDSIPGPAHLRYLTPESMVIDNANFEADENGYLFSPGKYEYSFRNYMQQLSSKFRKNYVRESSRLEAHGISFRHDNIADVDRLFRMNIESFGESSYFSDTRFLISFENLAAWLLKNRLLRITSVIIGGIIAAVDIGAVWGGNYTVLAGGTNPEFMGVAKLINFHHLEWSCIQRFETVDFLCGDFGWKERFHLTPRPLFQITAIPSDYCIPVSIHAERRVSCGL